MASRGRPPKIVRTLAEVLKEIRASRWEQEGQQKQKVWELDMVTAAYRNELCKEFWYYFANDPEGVRKKLARSTPVGFLGWREQNDSGSTGAHEVPPSYAPLPAGLIFFWAKKDPNWSSEPVIQCQINRWRRELLDHPGTSAASLARKRLTRIDRRLVPLEAPRAGHLGEDAEIHELYVGLVSRSRSLASRFRQVPRKTRSAKLSMLFDDLVNEEGEWRAWLWELADIGEKGRDRGIDDEALRGKKKQITSLLDTLIPKPKRPAKALIYDLVARVSGSSVQTVKNALKRERARRRKDVGGK